MINNCDNNHLSNYKVNIIKSKDKSSNFKPYTNYSPINIITLKKYQIEPLRSLFNKFKN